MAIRTKCPEIQPFCRDAESSNFAKLLYDEDYEQQIQAEDQGRRDIPV